jgi:hypothetical protein
VSLTKRSRNIRIFEIAFPIGRDWKASEKTGQNQCVEKENQRRVLRPSWEKRADWILID